VYPAAVDQAKVLLVVSHPSVGSGIETLLRLERRYDVRRATTLDEALSLAKTWPADAALVDATLLNQGERIPLGVPALVLAGNEARAAAVADALDMGRGWLRKDAMATELVTAVDGLTGAAPAGPGSLMLVGLVLLGLLFLGLLLYLLWLAIG
jgi:DNA-binding NarL/FixJ family response regulator